MDKALFRAYVKELVKETVEDEVKKILPKLLGEAVAEIKTLQENSTTTSAPSAKLSRSQLAQMMGLERLGDTIIATTNNLNPVMPAPPQGVSDTNPAFQAINRDYSAVMKKLGLSK